MPPLLQALWAVDACLTLDQLAEATGLNYRAVCRSMRRYVGAGWIERADRGCYCLTAEGRSASTCNVPLPAAASLTTGTHPRRPDSLAARLWVSMRTAGKFCRADLVALAALDEADAARLDGAARGYMSHLRRAGYLVRLPGTVRTNPISRGQTRWRLAHDTGPRAPSVRTAGVFDPNRGRTYTSVAPVGPA